MTWCEEAQIQARSWLACCPRPRNGTPHRHRPGARCKETAQSYDNVVRELIDEHMGLILWTCVSQKSVRQTLIDPGHREKKLNCRDNHVQGRGLIDEHAIDPVDLDKPPLVPEGYAEPQERLQRQG